MSHQLSTTETLPLPRRLHWHHKNLKIVSQSSEAGTVVFDDFVKLERRHTDLDILRILYYKCGTSEDTQASLRGFLLGVSQSVCLFCKFRMHYVSSRVVIGHRRHAEPAVAKSGVKAKIKRVNVP
jgi:hypothetical protein